MKREGRVSTEVGPAPGVSIPKPRTDVAHPLAKHFEEQRAARRANRGPPRAKRRAVITMVRNEPVFFPIWLAYYSRFFDPDDIYVLDHETPDGCRAHGDFVRIPVSHETIDHAWMVKAIEERQHELIERYDVVLVIDVDEIVAPRPELGTLGDYMDALDEPFVNCLGYELIHMIDREGPFDRLRPVLSQRRHWFANGAYNKPALAMEPMHWVPGFHRRVDRKMRIDPDLYLIHLHRMDYEICLERHRYRETRAWNCRDSAKGWARHNRIVDRAQFARWFYHDTSVPMMDLVIEPMPAWPALF